MIPERGFISYHIFETDGRVARAIEKFSILKGNLVDKIFYSYDDDFDNYKLTRTVLGGLGIYIHVTSEREIREILAPDENGYYVNGVHYCIVLEMSEKMKVLFDAICQAYEIKIPGMVWL